MRVWDPCPGSLMEGFVLVRDRDLKLGTEGALWASAAAAAARERDLDLITKKEAAAARRTAVASGTVMTIARAEDW